MKRAGCAACICGITGTSSSVCWCTWRRSTWDWSCASFWVAGRLGACRAIEAALFLTLLRLLREVWAPHPAWREYADSLNPRTALLAT